MGAHSIGSGRRDGNAKDPAALRCVRPTGGGAHRPCRAPAAAAPGRLAGQAPPSGQQDELLPHPLGHALLGVPVPRVREGDQVEGAVRRLWLTNPCEARKLPVVVLQLAGPASGVAALPRPVVLRLPELVPAVAVLGPAPGGEVVGAHVVDQAARRPAVAVAVAAPGPAATEAIIVAAVFWLQAPALADTELRLQALAVQAPLRELHDEGVRLLVGVDAVDPIVAATNICPVEDGPAGQCAAGKNTLCAEPPLVLLEAETLWGGAHQGLQGLFLCI
mmetsp:Transcript_86354/g.244786  ORF Transcript_86354/g.244786 Transcript_86354/m.244786 type:complete len:276 (+) Transcript_86354:100-927(+)